MGANIILEYCYHSDSGTSNFGTRKSCLDLEIAATKYKSKRKMQMRDSRSG